MSFSPAEPLAVFTSGGTMRMVLYSIFGALIAVGIFSGAAQDPIALIAIAIGLGILAMLWPVIHPAKKPDDRERANRASQGPREDL